MSHALREAGHRVTVIARAVSEESVVSDCGVEVHRIQPQPRLDDWRVLWRLNKFWPGFAWAAMRRLQALHRLVPVDIVEAGECRADSFFVTWLPQPRPRIITRLHLPWIFVDQQNSVTPDFKKRFTYWLEKQSILRADIVTAPSAAVVKLTQSWLGARLAAHVVPNPVDVEWFSPDDCTPVREVLFVGRLERRKGIDTLAQALPAVLDRCQDIRFRFVGSDGLDEHGRSWRARILDSTPPEQHHRIVFESISRLLLAERYRNADLCVVPSHWENFPYVALEAMSCGTPVVATRTGGLTEMIEHDRSGLLVPSEDPSALVDGICQLMNNPERLTRMRNEARRRVESMYSTATIVPKMVRLYRNPPATYSYAENLRYHRNA